MLAQVEPLPETWRKEVLRILEKGRFGRDIQVPKRTFDDWQADSLGAFPFEMHSPLVAALSQRGVTGKHIPNQPEPGETYAFWMYYRSRRFYAKICLHPGRVTIKILSAHLPDKGDAL